MKRLFLTISLLTVVMITACKYRKQYSSCDDLAPALKDSKYSDLVNDWGEPYQKEYYGPNNEWLCKWHGVGVNGTDAEIHFEDITYSWGEHDPFTVRGTLCQPIAPTASSVNDNNSNATVNNPNIYQIDSEATKMLYKQSESHKVDSNPTKSEPTVSNNSIPQVQVKSDSVPLIYQDWKHGHRGDYILSDKLPLTYKYGTEVFKFRMQNDSPKVDCYDSNGLYNTFNCRLQNNQLIMNSDGFFNVNEGKLYLVSRAKNYAIQLSYVRE